MSDVVRENPAEILPGESRSRLMRQYELVERVTSYDPDADEAMLNRAYVYAMKAHGLQTRASGDPYFSHPLEVAAILTDLKLDDATIVAALLHDTIEDTETTKQEIDTLFGAEIGALVEGLTKLKRLDLVTKEAAQAENLRKLLLAISDDIRVLLVKLADRLHNMRTLDHMKPEKRERIAQETMDIYAPLAGRIGMQQVRDELDEISFKELNPEAHKTISNRLARLNEESGNILTEIEAELRAKLHEHSIEAQVYGREKKAYSIWRKMERKQIALGQLSDIYGFRVIVNNIDDCYAALGVVHQTWRMVPGRFKEYISNPKTNDYRSLHTTVVGPHRMRVELQIRTGDMHEIAEKGVAAHAIYKEFGSSEEPPEKNGVEGKPAHVRPAAESNAYRWLRRLVDMLAEGESPKEFLEHTKLELFHDQVFCFSPKGDLIALPRGATPIDFAYAVHTGVGNTCVGSLINGRHAPLMSELENGDEVEIICSEAQVPPAAWEGFAITGKARSAIRRATRTAVRQQYAGLGKEIFERSLKAIGHNYDPARLESSIERLGENDVEDVLAKIGRGEIATADVMRAMDIADGKSGAAKAKEGVGSRLKSLGQMFPRARNRKKKSKSDAIPVRGLKSDLPLKISLETGAVPGERIVGILSPDVGVTIYPIFANKLQQFEDEPGRWIDLAWDVDPEKEERFPARITVTLLNEPGALGQVAKSIGDNRGNINSLQMNTQTADVYELHITVEVFDIKHLNSIIRELDRAGLVTNVARMAG
jgi:guanosine-3',5'-bis(diphosphate) 3'-pyrophosphohydrolase